MDTSRLMNAVALKFIDQEGQADAIPALNGFIAACMQKGQKAGYLPGVPANKNGYRYRSVTNWDKHPERGLLIPPDFALVGDGPKATKFFQDPASFDGAVATWPGHAFIFYSSGSSLQNLGFDGQRELIRNGAETAFTSCFIQAAEPNCRRASFSDLYMTGNLGGVTESFCLSTSHQEFGSVFERIVCRDNNGTGLSFNGDMIREITAPGTGLNSHLRIIDCSASNNTWQGFTAYGVQDSLVQNCQADGNGHMARWAGNGFNFEWTYRMHVEGGIYRDNIGGGIGGYGDNDALALVNVTTAGNNRRQSWDLAEIAFAPGPWWDQNTLGPLVGSLRSLAVAGGSFTPEGKTAYHLHVAADKPVTWPANGDPVVPQISVAGIAGARAWKLTKFTNAAGYHVTA